MRVEYIHKKDELDKQINKNHNEPLIGSTMIVIEEDDLDGEEIPTVKERIIVRNIEMDDISDKIVNQKKSLKNLKIEY